MSIKRIVTLVFYAIVLIVATIGFAKIFNADAFGKTIEEMKYDPDIIAGTSTLIGLSIALIVIVIASTFVVSPVQAIIANPKGFVKSLIGAVVLVVIFFIGYALSGDEVNRTYEAMGITTAGQSKLIGGVIYTVFLLIIIGIAAYVYSSISSLLKQL